MFPWEYVDGPWATKSEGVGLIIHPISFHFSKISNLCGLDPQTSQTSRRHAIARPRFAL